MKTLRLNPKFIFIILLIFCACICLFLNKCSAQTIIGNQRVDSFQTSPCNKYYALVYLPQDYNKDSSYPVIFFSHGTGQVGTKLSDLPKLITDGLPQRFAQGLNIPFIVVSPQCSGYMGERDIAVIVSQSQKKYSIDSNRIYITGLSAGGYSAWTCITDDTFFCKKIAAVAPISAAPIEASATFYNCIINKNQTILRVANIVNAAKYGIAVNDIIGDGDSFLGANQGFINQINNALPLIKAQIFIVPNTGHSAWQQAYDPNYLINGINLYEWFLQYHRNSTNPPPIDTMPCKPSVIHDTIIQNSYIHDTVLACNPDTLLITRPNGAVKKLKFIYGENGWLLQPDTLNVGTKKKKRIFGFKIN